MENAIVVFVNVPSEQNAQELAHRLVELQLAACVNILPGVRSVYRWQGALESADELTLMIKTTPARYAEIEAAIKTMHPYQVPEIIAIPVVQGLPEYLAWITRETRKDSNA